MCHRGVCDVDSEAFAEVLEFFGDEVRSVVGDDAVRYAKPVDNGFEELDGGFAFWLVTGMASIHLVNLSTVTRR